MEPKLQDSLTLERTVFTDVSTIGELHADGELLCHTIELSCRKSNPDGKLAIPCGKYEIRMTYSPKFQKEMPEVMEVPGRFGIRLHPANFASELEGCIAPGLRADKDAVYDSRKAFEIVLAEIQKRLTLGKLYIAIVGGSPLPQKENA